MPSRSKVSRSTMWKQSFSSIRTPILYWVMGTPKGLRNGALRTREVSVLRVPYHIVVNGAFKGVQPIDRCLAREAMTVPRACRRELLALALDQPKQVSHGIVRK